MIENRPDWCISRQRNWGVPLPFFMHKETGELHPRTLEIMEEVAKMVEEKGIESWATAKPEDFLPADEAADYVRSTDILDVWFDSGVTHYTVMRGSHADELAWPADLYLEGSDQHRGWFHSSLLTGTMIDGRAPYKMLLTHGFVVDEKGEKMSKSRGNVVNPNDIVAQYGADTMRLYIMFVGDFEQAATWSTDAVKGSKRFLDKVWNLAESAADSRELTPANEAILHKTIKKVTDDIDTLKMNTAIAAMMTAVNEMTANGVTKGDMGILLRLLNPFAPHITEELWEQLGFAAQTHKMCCQAEWPVYDASKTVASSVEMAIQVNGKMKGTVTMPVDSDEEAVKAAALAVDKVQKATEGMQIVKTILVKNRLINLIVKPQ